MEHPIEVIVKQEPIYEDEETEKVFEVEIDVKAEDCPSMEQNLSCENPTRFEGIGKKSDKKRFECKLCHVYFNNRHCLFKHNVKHLKIVLEKCTAFKCNTCLIYFTQEDKLKVHMLEHVKTEKQRLNLNIPVTKQLHQCHICGKVLSYKSWHEHIRQVHAVERVPCPKCNKDFKCLRTLIRHNLYVHERVIAAWRTQTYENTDVITCSICKKMFSNKSSLKTHNRNCHSGQKYHCYICKSALKSKSYLMTHIRRVHFFDGKEHLCDVCGKKFKSPRYVKAHKRNSHCSIVSVSIKVEPSDEDSVNDF